MVYSGSQTEFPFLDKQELMVRDRPWSAQLGANLNFINHIGNYSHSVSNSKGEPFHIKFSVSPESSLIIRWFSSVQSLSHVRIFVTPWTAAPQASLSVTNYQSLLRLMSIESAMPSNHLISVNNLSTMQETQVQSLSQEDFLEKGMATHSSNIA